jgi:hypothetical protein
MSATPFNGLNAFAAHLREEPQEMLEENKRYFRKILTDFISRYPFNPALFPAAPTSDAGAAIATAEESSPVQMVKPTLSAPKASP